MVPTPALEAAAGEQGTAVALGVPRCTHRDRDLSASQVDDRQVVTHVARRIPTRGRTTETELPAEVRGKPAQVRLDGEKLLIEPLA